MHLWSVGFSPSRSATAWWNMIVAMLSRRPACASRRAVPIPLAIPPTRWTSARAEVQTCRRNRQRNRG